MAYPIAVVAVEFDGGLVVLDSSPPVWSKGAREFVAQAPEVGVRVIVHSCRATLARPALPGDAEEFFAGGRLPPEVEAQWAALDEMRAFLAAEGLALEIWDAPGKPVADLYLDRLAEPPDFLVVGLGLGMRLRG